MLDYTGGVFVKLDLGFTPSPSGGGLFVVQAEEVGDAFVLMYGYTPSLDAADRREGTALITVIAVQQSVIGYPNEEAFWCDDRGDVGHGFYELIGSAWSANVAEYNNRTYGSRHQSTPGGLTWLPPAHHFFVGSKEDSAQFLAQALRVEMFTDRPYNAVRDEVIRRIDNWYEWARLQGRHVDAASVLTRSYPDDIAQS